MKSLLVILLVFIGFATAIDLESDYDEFDGLESLDNFEFENNEYDNTLPNSKVRPILKPTKTRKNPSLMTKYIQFLFAVSNTSAQTKENPDLKYEQPGKEIVTKLTGVMKAVMDLSKPLIKFGKLLVEDFMDTIKKVDKAVQNNNIFQAKHLVGEHFIAVNRRIASLVIYAASTGLFDFKSAGNENIVKAKREFDEHSQKAKSVVNYILKNFNQFRVSDGIPDGPLVILGVQTAKIYILAFQQSMKLAKIESSMIIDMIADMVRLGVDMKNREAAVQRAAASILSMVRRQVKINVAVARAYKVKKCYNSRQQERAKGHE